jgi:catechol 2,3-dioxygenase-like lactoylglutathione lyase family enzyme
MFIQSLHLRTNDLATTKKFYTELLQTSVIKESEQHVSFGFGHSTLNFHASYESDPFYHVAFSIPNNKLEEALEWVRERTDILPYSDKEIIANFIGWNAKAFYFHDNNQNILELITHYDLKTSSTQPFSAALITGICEIGITVEDVAHACNEFYTLFHIPYFAKGPRLNDFAVMGDSNGMFIVSKTGRGWLPTMRQSEKHWTKVLVENDGVKNEFVFE